MAAVQNLYWKGVDEADITRVVISLGATEYVSDVVIG